jgi:opacity protein-like surface antigen
MREACGVPRFSILIPVVAAAMLALAAPPARAQGFISPFIGYNFSGDAGCPSITDCKDKHANYGVSFGAIGSVVGFESEIGFTKDFFGASATQSTDVFTFMANFMLAPKFGPIQVYGVAGTGLMRTSVESVGQNEDENQIAWDVGGGIIGYFSKHIGIRGDVRYFHSFQLLDLSKFPPLSQSQTKLNFGRVSIVAMFKF